MVGNNHACLVLMLIDNEDASDLSFENEPLWVAFSIIS